MGHAAHFLQRLDRVNEMQVELALTLYRDDQLLKAVLGYVALPDGAERVAVSLGDPVEGTFVVLTRTESSSPAWEKACVRPGCA